MKKINIDLIKDVIISILLVIVIALIVSVIFYDKISINKVIPEASEYSLSEEMKEDINKTNVVESTQVVTDYYIDAYDIKKAENNTYFKGKQNPLAKPDYSVYNNNVTENNLITNNSVSSNFYEDTGMK